MIDHDKRLVAPASRRYFLSQLAAASFALLAGAARAASAPASDGARRNKVLLVSTNIGTIGKNVSGTYLPEIAYPFQYFVDQGYGVDIATPKGGKASIYDPGARRPELAEIERSKAFVEASANTLAPTAVKPEQYAGIYYPGGHGQYFDVLGDERIAAIAATIHQSGGVIGTAGHGAVCLVNVRLADGSYFVRNKRMTCFPGWAEKLWMNLSDFGALLPFDMEVVLRERGANLVVCTRETMNDPNLVLISDDANRLVTGSFASGAKPVAQQMHRLLQQRT